MNDSPDFIVIGSMKSANSTLHEQLSRQDAVFMAQPQDLNFFSNDETYAKGIEWYRSLYGGARQDVVCGESSTHYTKLPTYPRTLERMLEHAPGAKLIYLMRHPIDRLVSQYIHEWSANTLSAPINEAIEKHPELVEYSKYALQLEAYLEAYGKEKVLPIFFPRFMAHPKDELERVGRFLGIEGRLVWQEDMEAQNVSKDRMRESAWRDALVDSPILSTLRRRFIPKSWRTRIRSFWQMRERPELSVESRAHLEEVFDEDLAVLGGWLGVDLRCANFDEVMLAPTPEWK